MGKKSPSSVRPLHGKLRAVRRLARVTLASGAVTLVRPRPLPALLAWLPSSLGLGTDCLSLSAASWTSQDSWFPW